MKASISLFLLLVTASSFGQQPQPLHPARIHLAGAANAIQTPAAQNYQLELEVQRGERKANYKITLNGGSVSTELIDRLAKQGENEETRFISFHATLTPFDESGGEVAVSLSRVIPFTARTPVLGAPAGPTKETLQFRSIPLSTKVSLYPEQAVVLFEDEEERISLKLSVLDAPIKARAESRDQCRHQLRQIDGAKEQWALENKKREGDAVSASDIEEYIRGGKLPRCQEGGVYRIGKIGEAPSCSVQGHTL